MQLTLSSDPGDCNILPAASSLASDAARRYVQAGLSVIPVRADGSKAPALPRGEVQQYRARRPGGAELAAWFGPRSRSGVGVLAGPASGNLVVLDFETDPVFRAWATQLSPADRDALGGSPLARTPGGGWHLYLRLPEPVNGCKLARTAAGGCLIETRGHGHYVIAPGSPPACHPAGRTYRWVRPGWIGHGPCARAILPDLFDRLLVSAADLNEYRRPAAREVVGDRPGVAAGGRPGDDFNQRAGWADVLAPHGWKVFRSSDRITYWTRPGKPTGVSASTGFCTGPTGNGLLYVFSTSAAPFEAETTYSKFAAYGLLNHRGDLAAAARALGLAGYGRPAALAAHGRGVRA